MDLAMPSHFMWDDADFSPTSSEGMQSSKVVGLPLVEKVQIVRGCILFTRWEEKRPVEVITPGTAGHRLRPKIPNIVGFPQWHMARAYTPCIRRWPCL
jgi:hypothetical protein